MAREIGCNLYVSMVMFSFTACSSYGDVLYGLYSTTNVRNENLISEITFIQSYIPFRLDLKTVSSDNKPLRKLEFIDTQHKHCEYEYHDDSFIHVQWGVWPFDCICSLLGCNILE